MSLAVVRSTKRPGRRRAEGQPLRGAAVLQPGPEQPDAGGVLPIEEEGEVRADAVAGAHELLELALRKAELEIDAGSCGPVVRRLVLHFAVVLRREGAAGDGQDSANATARS